jgi:DNA-binding Xre family transcriptional regulator
MLSYNFTRILRSRGVDKPFSYLVKHGFSDNFSSRIANNRVSRLNLSEMEKLCELFHCTPNEIMEWIPGSSDIENINHPLYPLKRSNKVVELTKMLNSIPLDKLNDIENIIKKEIEK